MRKTILSIVMMLLCVLVYAQELPKIIPPSPEATSIAKFTEVPVSHYTGLPSISIPIYTIQSGDISIPIGLSYHARGVRVEEVASRVGLGWALNAGGIISRQTRGGVDEHDKGYYTENYYSDFGTNEERRGDVWTESLKGADPKIDLAPDQFNFQFPGGSGKFIFDQRTKEILVQSYSDIKIENFGFKKWKITTSDGYTYYFGEPNVDDSNRYAKDKDVSHGYLFDNGGLTDLGGSGYDTVNSWHLIDMITPRGNKVHFNYEKESLNYHRRSYDKYDKKTNGATSFFSRISGTQYQLKEIVFKTGKVIFNKEISEREDLTGSHRLESIEVKDSNGARIKKYKLNHSYSNDAVSDNTNVLDYLEYADPKAKKRLFLDAIKEVSITGVAQHYYSIEYTNKQDLPNRFSNSQDLWGYYNGKNNGSFLTFHSQSINREVDEEKAKIGLISKVITPTRGYRKFTFEPNKAVPPEYFYNLYFRNPNPTSSSANSNAVSLLKSPANKAANGDYEKPFSVGENAVNFRSQILFFGNFGECSKTENVSGCKYQVSIVGVNGTSYYSSIYMGTHNYPTMLSAGDYKLVVKVIGGDDSSDLQNGFTITLTWGKVVVSEPEIIYSGGNRIKEVEINSIDNGKIFKSYEYLTAQGKSSGLLYSLPSYYLKHETFDISGAVVMAEQYGARPGSPYTYEQGNHVGYSHVTEYINGSSEQGKGGKIAYEFTAMPDEGEFYKPPYTLPINNEWLRGKPLNITYYKKKNESYSPVKNEAFVYRYADAPSYKAFSIPLITEEDPNNDPLLYLKNKKQYLLPLISFKLNEDNPVDTNHNDYKIYYLTGGVQKLFSKKETTYNDIGKVSTTISYNYNYNKHYQVAGSETINSKKDVYKTDNEYDVLSNPFRVIPTQTISYKNDNLLSKQKTIYSDNHNSASLYLPSKIQVSKGINLLEDRVIYHSYDDKGNPTEVSKKDGTKIYYVWGYQQTQPIAKIEGYTTAQLSAAQTKIKAAIAASNNDSSVSLENILRDKLQLVRDAFPNSQFTSYTYDPLIGVTSITDPRGQTIYYEYDEFNRLEFIKDTQKNILKENKYNYKN